MADEGEDMRKPAHSDWHAGAFGSRVPRGRDGFRRCLLSTRHAQAERAIRVGGIVPRRLTIMEDASVVRACARLGRPLRSPLHDVSRAVRRRPPLRGQVDRQDERRKARNVA
jgi:hypothetical protein